MPLALTLWMQTCRKNGAGEDMTAWEIVKKSWSDFSDDDCSTLSAALAYFTAFSLPSVLLIVLVIAGSVLGRAAVEGQIEGRIGSTVGPQVGTLVQGMVASAARSATGGVIATALGIAGLIYAATNVFGALQTAMNRAWDVKAEASGFKSMALKRIGSFFLIVGIALLILISLAAATAATGLAGHVGITFPGWLMYLAEIFVSWVLFLLLFGVLYKVLPDAEIQWKDVWVGAMVTSALFIVGKFLIALYMSHTTTASAYGAAGALALLLLWTYYCAMIFLFGMEFTQVWARAHGRAIEPHEGAVRVPTEEPKKAA